MKFKVGDRVRVKENLEGDRTYDGLLFNSQMAKYIGKVFQIEKVTASDYCLKGINFFWNDAMLDRYKLTKQELVKMPTGTKIYTDADDEDYQEWLKVSKYCFYNFENAESFIDDSLDDDLKFDKCADEDYGTRIIKVEEPEYKTAYECSPELKEMTIAEIEKELGYPIKVIKESEDN